MRQIVGPTELDVIRHLTAEIDRCAEEAIKTADVFRVGISGGSMLNYLRAALKGSQTDLGKWRFFLCDERYVPEDDAESTYGNVKRSIIPGSGLKQSQFAAIKSQLPLEECAADYEQQIRAEFELKPNDSAPAFDLLLLGMGPDGHTCSLFPGHALLKEVSRLIAPINDSPKPPPQRVTMTLPLISQAKCCIFAICGEGKADMVKRVFVDKDPLPAGMVAPQSGELICIFDKAAGKYIE